MSFLTAEWRKLAFANYGKVYGTAFAFLNQATPSSVMLAEGSAITVESKRVIS